MVLEGATASASIDDNAVQDPPVSDADSYAVDVDKPNAGPLDPRTPSTFHVKPQELPKIWSWTMTRHTVRRDDLIFVAHYLGAAEQEVNRRLRQDEVDALSYHLVDGLRTNSTGKPIGLAAGYAYSVMSKSQNSLFGISPGPDHWIGPRRFGPLRGQRAFVAFRLLRRVTHICIGMLVAQTLLASYSAAVCTRGKAADPRLKEFNEEVARARLRAVRSAGGVPMEPRAGQRSPIGTQQGGMDSQIEKAIAALERGREQYARREGNDDDMSPTDGSWGNDTASSETGLLTDDQMRQRERRQRSDAQYSPTSNRDSTFDMDKVTSQPTAFDDASPQAGTENTRQRPAGSAWERLRSEAAANQQSPRQQNPNQRRGQTWMQSQSQSQAQSQSQRQGRTAGWGSVQKEQQEGATLGDSFAFSTSDEERQLAKSEAQRDFDQRLERERRGGDFNERGGKRW